MLRRHLLASRRWCPAEFQFVLMQLALLISENAALLMLASVDSFALRGRAIAVTLRVLIQVQHLLVLCSGGIVLGMFCNALRRCWTSARSLGLLLTWMMNPHFSLSTVIPDSFSPMGVMCILRVDAESAGSALSTGAFVWSCVFLALWSVVGPVSRVIRISGCCSFCDRGAAGFVAHAEFHSPLAPCSRERNKAVHSGGTAETMASFCLVLAIARKSAGEKG